ncbi:Prohead protease [uncultured Caudovirales phage]|uniref:Prohead protease n=1 Tax=uncultured Caudovirales phage TaxID=2100421 RepID=A0A6J5M9U6_9CAUD|nr:Prohead protease [uncultured Caudovirales phage]
MPYYITDKNSECSNWAVEKEDGELIACHDTKESAIDQAVAISIEEGTEFVGERAAIGSLAIDDYVSWSPLDPRVAAQVVMVEEQFAVVRLFEYEDGIFSPTDKMMVINVFQLEKIPTPKMIAYEVEEIDEPDQPDDDEGEANLPDNYRPALAEDVPEGRACGNCFFFDESRVNADGDEAWCEKWDAFVEADNYCNAWEPNDEDRAINQEAPAYMRAAARRGLEYYEEGLAGDGVTPQTIREAREMAEGRVSDDKWIRIAAWIARHLVDLDSPDANPESDNYPSAGVVAHLLWGSGPSKRAAQRTKDYADSVVARIRQEETNSMDNKNKWLDVARAIQLKIDGPQAQSKEPEVRTNSVDFEVRAEGDGMTFTGYASVFNSPSEDLGGFVEYVAPGAFKRSLQSRNEVKLLWNHDSGEPLASLRGGTMQLVEDSVGLRVTAKLPNTTRGRDIAELLRTKVIDSMSFGFNVIKDSWSRDGQTRTLESVRLFETSIVSFPAYAATTATVRSAPSINADELADALLKLESGEELDEKNANLITEVVSKLKAQPEVQEAEDNGLSILDLKQKQFDLLMKRI